MSFLIRRNFSLLKRYGTYSQIKSFLHKIQNVRTSIYGSPTLLETFYKFNGISKRTFYNTSFDFDTYLKKNQNPDDEIFKQHAVRDFLFPDSKDPLIETLNNCKSIHNLLEVIKDNGDKMQPEHIAQTVLVLWDLQKMFFDVYQISVTQNMMVKDHLKHVLQHEDFKKLLDLVEKNISGFTPEALSCILLYLTKMGLSLDNRVLQKIVLRLQDFLKSDNLPLIPLSLFIVATSDENNTAVYKLAGDAVPFIVQQLEKCQNVEDFKLITICLNGLKELVTDDTLDIYCDKVRSFLDRKLLDSKNLRAVFKVLTFLSFSNWKEKTAALTSQVMLLLKNNLHHLNVNDLVIPYMVISKNKEPGVLLPEFQNVSVQLWKEVHEDPTAPISLKVKLLKYSLYFTELSNCSDFDRVVQDYLEEPLEITAIFDLLKILLGIKSSQLSLYDQLWTKLMEKMKAEKLKEDEKTLWQVSYKYLAFYQSIHLRNEAFESFMISQLSDKLKSGLLEAVPTKLAIATSFLLEFGKEQEMVNCCVDKIVENYDQLSAADCLFVSRCLQKKNPLVDLKTINRALDMCVSHRLDGLKDFNEVTNLLSACVYRKQHCDNVLIDRLLLNIKNAPVTSSNIIRSLCMTLTQTRALVPEILDKISYYITNCEENLMGFNAIHILQLFYTLGYSPKNEDKFFPTLINVIERDQDRLFTHLYLQAVLSLCFFKKLPFHYAEDIFNEEVLVKIEEEIKNSQFMDSYAFRVRDQLMQLNRAVYLDYPELKVPWFHQKYVADLKKQRNPRDSKFSSDVAFHLLQLTESKKLVFPNYLTKFGYVIDILLYLNKNKKFVDANGAKDGTRMAILLPRAQAYTRDFSQLNGETQLKVRHLKAMGYKVVVIRWSHWSLLTSPEDKLNYLIRLLDCHDTENASSCSYSFVPN